MSDENSSAEVPASSPSGTSRSSSLIPRIRRALRGEVDARTIAREAVRRARASLRQRRERGELDRLNARSARLTAKFAGQPPGKLLNHFRTRTDPSFFAGFVEIFAAHVPAFKIRPAASRPETSRAQPVEWNRDPLSGVQWPLDYHADLELQRGNGSDARALWELNRMGHELRLACTYAVTRDEGNAEEFFTRIASWRAQNPVGRGPNWACAMEVALRAMNFLAALEIFRHSPSMDEKRLGSLLDMLDQHGEHLRRNLEFSYISTSNHYLSDVIGLLWLGIMVPELRGAHAWRKFGLREMLREMEKQILPDGADFEASTGYHRLVLELFMYSFILCRENGVAIPQEYWDKLRAMTGYLRAYLRPDGRAPLIGDTDGGQVMPLIRHDGDDHAYLAGTGAALFDEPAFKVSNSVEPPRELFWLLGRKGEEAYAKVAPVPELASQAFPEAGAYILRDADLYLLFNTSGNGLNGRGSHGHNDALSIEVSAGETAFLVDPGTYIYSADWDERQRFRSTAYHSTAAVDETEQNITDRNTPFVMGDEAHPRMVSCDFSETRDLVVAEHGGYHRLPEPVTHRRAVEFNKPDRYWLITDTFTGGGKHQFDFYFHFAPGLTIESDGPDRVRARDEKTGAQLLIVALEPARTPTLEPRFSSRDYGVKVPSVAARWTISTDAPLLERWAVIPISLTADEKERLAIVDRLRHGPTNA